MVRRVAATDTIWPSNPAGTRTRGNAVNPGPDQEITEAGAGGKWENSHVCYSLLAVWLSMTLGAMTLELLAPVRKPLSQTAACDAELPVHDALEQGGPNPGRQENA